MAQIQFIATAILLGIIGAAHAFSTKSFAVDWFGAVWVLVAIWAILMVRSPGGRFEWTPVSPIALWVPLTTYLVLRWSSDSAHPRAWYYWLIPVAGIVGGLTYRRIKHRKDIESDNWRGIATFSSMIAAVIAIAIALIDAYWYHDFHLFQGTRQPGGLWYKPGDGLELEFALWLAVATLAGLWGSRFHLVPYSIAVAVWVAMALLYSKHPGQLVYWLPIAATAYVWPLLSRNWYEYPEKRTRVREGGATAEPSDEIGIEKMEADRARRANVKRKPSFDDIYGMKDVKQRLLDAHRDIEAAATEGKQARNGVLLHGGPGNGKTVFARALANELHLPLITMTGGEVASQWVGETTVNVRKAFAQARTNAPCVFFIDEVDSLLRSRDGRAMDNTQEARTLVNTMLTEIVTLRSHRVILIAATNHIDALDAAGIREGRFDFKIEIPPPDEEARIGLLRQGLLEHAPKVRLPEDQLLAAARRWKGFSVKRIQAIVEELPRYLAEHPRADIGLADLMACLRRVQGRASGVPENAKSLDELILTDGARLQMRSIARRMRDIHEIEAMGGSVPDGVLFFGPPGTGKTEAVRALAKESGWALLTTTGHDLIAHSDELDKIYAKASDLRPAIIFIDEGDDILMDRSFSQARAVTNKLLTLMDGVSGKTPDVLFVTATNNPDAMDSAVLRGGRFTEKVEFALPETAVLPAYIEGWIARKKVRLATDARQAAQRMAGCSIANVNAVLQSAVNLAIGDAHAGTQVVIENRHLDLALVAILGKRD